MLKRQETILSNDRKKNKTPKIKELKHRESARSSKRKKVDVKVELRKLVADGISNVPQNETKDQKTIPTNLETNVTDVQTINDSANYDNICPGIDHLTNVDIDELINDVNSFITDGTFDEILSVGVVPSSNPNLSKSPIPDAIESLMEIDSLSNQENVGALDLSINKETLPISQTDSTSSLKVINRSLMKSGLLPPKTTNYHQLLIPKAEPLNFIRRACEIPPAHLPKRVQVIPEYRLVDEKYATTSQSNVSYLPKTVQKAKKHHKSDKGFRMPIMILEEILGLQGIKATYDLLTNQATDISQIFQYRVWFKDQDANGFGKSLEDAKNSAARALMDKLANKNYFGNKIGALQELCMARRLPLPVYGYEMEIHSRDGHDFIVSCTVLEHTTFGQGSNKKIAKLFAGYKMYNYLN